MDETLVGLTEILSISDEDIERFQRRLNEPRRIPEIPLSYDLNEEEIAGWRYTGTGSPVSVRPNWFAITLTVS